MDLIQKTPKKKLSLLLRELYSRRVGLRYKGIPWALILKLDQKIRKGKACR